MQLNGQLSFRSRQSANRLRSNALQDHLEASQGNLPGVQYYLGHLTVLTHSAEQELDLDVWEGGRPLKGFPAL